MFDFCRRETRVPRFIQPVSWALESMCFNTLSKKEAEKKEKRKTNPSKSVIFRVFSYQVCLARVNREKHWLDVDLRRNRQLSTFVDSASLTLYSRISLGNSNRHLYFAALKKR